MIVSKKEVTIQDGQKYVLKEGKNDKPKNP